MYDSIQGHHKRNMKCASHAWIIVTTSDAFFRTSIIFKVNFLKIKYISFIYRQVKNISFSYPCLFLKALNTQNNTMHIIALQLKLYKSSS